ncbi:hypothetical protein PF010_g6442 [Phytophthora fragariae]|nr:hypothetical protein PF010_g6442 [Phytophthora fragariae]
MIYVRQIYKQQLSDTTLKGANAPRYFEGVQGNPQQRGELFGIANLIYWKPGGVLKGIQDAYQRSRDGLIIQQNRVQYNAAAMRKPTKKSTPKMQLNVVDDDEGEMIEVADELVSDMLSAEELPTQPPIEEKRTALSSDSGDDDDMDALLNGATTFRHEEIVGEQDDEQETYHLEGNTAVIDESESEQDDTASREALEHGEQAQPTPVKSRGSILSRMKDVKSPNGESTPDRSDQKRIYVPTYL